METMEISKELIRDIIMQFNNSSGYYNNKINKWLNDNKYDYDIQLKDIINHLSNKQLEQLLLLI